MTPVVGGVAVGVLVALASVAGRSTRRRLTAPPLVPGGADGAHVLRSSFRGARRRLPIGRWRRRRDEVDLGVLVDAASRAAAGGASLLPALTAGAEVAGPPLVDAVARLARRVEAGLPLDTALAWWARDAEDADITLLVAACRLGAQLGRGTAVALDGIAASIRQQRSLRDELAVATSSTAASAVVLCCLPVAVVAILSLADARAVRWLLMTPAGWVCLLCAAGLDLAGAWWMRLLVRGASS